jgi:uncharacterized membrane protein YccC
MPRGRLTIARLLGLVVFCGIVLGGVRSGSNDSFKSIYTLTFVALIYAAIAARYRGPFWYGAAVAGWAYFLVGFGQWIETEPGFPPPQAVNRNLVTAIIPEAMSGLASEAERAAQSIVPPALARLDANRAGVCHCALTILFAYLGGRVSRVVARRSAT